MELDSGSGDAGTFGWNDARQAEWYLHRIGGLAERRAGEEVLRTLLPEAPRSVLDLGCGDGRLTELLLESCPTVERAIAIDRSEPMLERAMARFKDDQRVIVRRWDLMDSIGSFGSFDVIVSGFAIHHLENDRKRSLIGEVAQQLVPRGLFANLDVVASATAELHAEFLELIGRTADDPEDRLTDIASQVEWMRAAGMSQAECFWRWRGFALMAARIS